MIRIVSGVVLVLVALFGYGFYQTSVIPDTASAAETAWAGVEAQYRHRAELTPAIIDVLRSINDTQTALIGDLSSTQEDILKAPMTQAPRSLEELRAFMRRQDKLSRNLGLVYDFLKYYPDRMRDEKIRATMSRLEQSEQDIVTARELYMTRAANLDAMLSRPPQSWIAQHLQPIPQILNFDFDHASTGS